MYQSNSFSMNKALREYVRSKFCEMIPELGRNMEKSLYNSVGQGIHDTSTAHFSSVYKSRFLGLMENIKRNPSIICRIKNGELKSSKFADYSPDILEPDGIFSEVKLERREIENRREKAEAQRNEDYVGLLKCGKCKSVKTTYYQMQTRSADEPMTTYVTCLNCQHKWKF